MAALGREGKMFASLHSALELARGMRPLVLKRDPVQPLLKMRGN